MRIENMEAGVSIEFENLMRILAQSRKSLPVSVWSIRIVKAEKTRKSRKL